MAWTNSPFTVWHGTVGPYADLIVRNGPDLKRCRDATDFGRGFYVTRIRAHAVLHANERYSELKAQYDLAMRLFRSAFDPERAAVIEYRIDLDLLGALDTLAFVQATPEWREFVEHCRKPICHHKPASGNYYDVVYGPMFDVGSDSAVPGREQISFHSPQSLPLLIPVGGPASITYGGPSLP